jgi:MSHA biogenesis protein MshM
VYLAHFGFEQPPFSLTPNTRFFFQLGGHREAFATLLVALRAGEGFVKVVGEVGTGKTMLCRTLMRALGREDFETAYIPNPMLSPLGLYEAVARELGLPAPLGIDPYDVLQEIQRRLIEIHRGGRRVVLLIDEAQALSEGALEALRLLTNLETETRKLLQVVLFGQPELDAMLARPGLRQLRQRISFGARLSPLDRAATAEYVRYRLGVAGYARAALFSRPALRALARASGGVPRLVNLLCHKSALAAYGEGALRIRRRHVRRAIADTEGLGSRPAWRPVSYGLVALATTAAGWLALRGPLP